VNFSVGARGGSNSLVSCTNHHFILTKEHYTCQHIVPVIVPSDFVSYLAIVSASP
jgi:hypothetical protein